MTSKIRIIANFYSIPPKPGVKIRWFLQIHEEFPQNSPAWEVRHHRTACALNPVSFIHPHIYLRTLPTVPNWQLVPGIKCANKGRPYTPELHVVGVLTQNCFPRVALKTLRQLLCWCHRSSCQLVHHRGHCMKPKQRLWLEWTVILGSFQQL